MTIETEGGIMIYGAADSVIKDIFMEQIHMHVRAPDTRIAQSVGGNFDLRWTATNFTEAIFGHDIPAIFVRYLDGLRVRDFDLTWGDGLPAYFSNALEAQDAKNLDYADFKMTSAPGSLVAPVWCVRCRLTTSSLINVRTSHALTIS